MSGRAMVLSIHITPGTIMIFSINFSELRNFWKWSTVESISSRQHSGFILVNINSWSCFWSRNIQQFYGFDVPWTSLTSPKKSHILATWTWPDVDFATYRCLALIVVLRADFVAW